MWANEWSGARLFGLEEKTFFCTFELFSQGLPLPPTQETNTETGLFSVAPVAEGYSGKSRTRSSARRELGMGKVHWRQVGAGRGNSGQSWVKTREGVMAKQETGKERKWQGK